MQWQYIKPTKLLNDPEFHLRRFSNGYSMTLNTYKRSFVSFHLSYLPRLFSLKETTFSQTVQD